MHVRFVITLAAFAAIAAPVSAQQYQRRAVVTGRDNSGGGKCTIEVVVDGVAEVEVRGDNATLRNVSGQPPQWRRFECTGVLPANPANFRFAGVDGRGKQELVRDPRNGGSVVVRIEDPEGGAGEYKFDLTWGGGNGFPSGRDGRDNPQYGERDRVIDRRISTDQAVRVCQDSVRQQAATQFRTRDVAFRETRMDDNRDRRDWIVGTIAIRRMLGREETYRFSCSIDFDNGRVRSAQIDRTQGGNTPGYGQGNPAGNRRAVQSCQGAVEERLRSNGYDRVEFVSINVDDRPGRNDWVVGKARGEGRDHPETFDFSCSVNLEDGVVRSVDVKSTDVRRR
jgi:hypothetical protein